MTFQWLQFRAIFHRDALICDGANVILTAPFRDGLTHTRTDLMCLSTGLSAIHCLAVAACSNEKVGALRQGFVPMVRATRGKA
jgi:hypothetical protein